MAVVKGHGQHIAYKHTPCAHIAVVVRHRHARQAAVPSTEQQGEGKKTEKIMNQQSAHLWSEGSSVVA